MTYIQVQQLATDATFQSRVVSCMWNQALTYQTDADAPSAAMGQAVLRGPTPATMSMVNMIAAFPGLVDGAVITKGDNSQMVDQTAVPDEEILGQVQANWKTVAGLFYATVPPVP